MIKILVVEDEKRVADLLKIGLEENGFGMSAQDKENLFTLFYRGGNKKAAEGHGIGMALSQKIIHLHSGNISVHSEQGKGTTFTVELPHV